MRCRLSWILSITLVAASALVGAAQGSKENTNSVAAAEELRAQLFDVQTKESELQARARQLDEDLKPENTERSLAGIGSTKPEELRELRRRQLTIERDRVQSQLKLVATSRERLESVIRFAETQAYQESAAGTNAPLQMIKGHNAASPRALSAMVAGLAILGIVFIAVMRKIATV